jgi:hypothetical protein
MLRRPIDPFRFALLVFCPALFFAAPLVHAQVVPGPPAIALPATPGQSDRIGAPSAGSADAAVPDEFLARAPFQWGVVNVRPHALYRYLYVDGLQSQPGQLATTSLHTLSPGLTFDVGRGFSFDYTPTWNFYSNHAFKDTVDHAAQLALGGTYDRWILSLTQSYVVASPTLVETGGQTKEESWLTAGDAIYRLGPHLQAEATVNQSLRYTQGFSDVREWSTLDWLRLQASDKVDLAAGAGLGYVDVSTGSDMTYAQLRGEMNWRPTDKISFLLGGGVERRQFRSGGIPSLNSPLVTASVSYLPLNGTRLTLGTTRGVSASYFANEATVNKGIDLRLEQHLLETFTLSVAFSHQDVEYKGGATTGRSDTNRTFDVRLASTFLHRGSIAAVYRDSRISSSVPGYSYDSSQIGFEIGYRL